MGRREAYTGFWWGNLRESGHLRDSDVDGRKILILIFGKLDGSCGLDQFGSG
jgi:hypothetical protein